MSVKFGEVNWNEEPKYNKEKNKDLFLKLEQGSNEVRILTQPYQYMIHQFKIEGDKNQWGHRVFCSKVNGKCILCDDYNNKPKARWYIGVICRKTNSYKLLDMSYTVFSQIRNLATNKKWGDPTKYDIDITVNKQGGATGYYLVSPNPHSPLSLDDQKIKDSVDLDELKARVTPRDPEWVEERVKAIEANVEKVKPKNESQAAAAEDDDDDDNDDVSFPAYDG